MTSKTGQVPTSFTRLHTPVAHATGVVTPSSLLTSLGTGYLSVVPQQASPEPEPEPGPEPGPEGSARPIVTAVPSAPAPEVDVPMRAPHRHAGDRRSQPRANRVQARGARRQFVRSTSVRVPFAAGLFAFASLAVSVPLFLGGDPTPSEMSNQYVADQVAVTHDAAQAIRRSLNEGVVDLEMLAQSVSLLGGTREDVTAGLLVKFAGVYDRFSDVSLVGPNGRSLITGSLPHPGVRLPWAQVQRQAGMVDVSSTAAGGVTLLQYAPVRQCPVAAPGVLIAPGGCPAVAAVVGYYDPTRLLTPATGDGTGRVWLVDGAGRVLAGPGRASALGLLPGPALREAGQRAAQGESAGVAQVVSRGRTELITFSPIQGLGPSGDLGWSLVAQRSVSALGSPVAGRARTAVALGAALGLVTLGIFLWFWVAIIRPLDHLEHEADRLAHGDLEMSVGIVRGDEIGLVARSLDRMRLDALRMRLALRSDNPGPRRAGDT